MSKAPTCIAIFYVGVAALVVALTPVGGDSPSKRFSPIILVPGDGGSQLQAKLDKPRRVHPFCDQRTDDYFNLWLNPGLLVPGVLDCWVDNMRLVYNRGTRKTENSPGVDIRVPGFGNTTSVEWLDPSGILPPFVARFIMSAYYVDIVNALVNAGYRRGEDVRGAPFDYRKAPNEMDEYFTDLKNLVEDTYKRNDGTPVTVVCHSMGCPISSYFLGQQAQAWKDRHVKALVGLAGAWGGAAKAMKVMASGENLGIMIVSQTKLRIEQRTSPSIVYMLPSRLIWKPNDVLAMGNSRNYSVVDMEDFFRDINFPDGLEMYQDLEPLAERGLQPPQVEVHCIHGQQVSTPEMIDYRSSKNFPDDYSLISGDGDGTVNLRSLSACRRWIGRQSQPVHHLSVPRLEHMEILSDKTVIEYILDVASTWS